jgi:hypothetical protein
VNLVLAIGLVLIWYPAERSEECDLHNLLRGYSGVTPYLVGYTVDGTYTPRVRAHESSGGTFDLVLLAFVYSYLQPF